MIIKNILDQDLYKLSMQNAILELFPNSQAEYRFTNRGNQNFKNEDFIKELKQEVFNMRYLKLHSDQAEWLSKTCPYLKPQYIEYLKNYKFDPSQVKILFKNDQLDIKIKGPWYSTILWEVPLMAIISELYFKIIEKNWHYNNANIQSRASEKFQKLSNNNCLFADFGTRRRRSFEIQNTIIETFAKLKNQNNTNFVGTSNVYLAYKNDLKPIGTCAHEWIQGMQVLESFNHCNYFAMQNWVKIYNTALGIFLTDTITTDMFLKNFNRRFAMLFDGIRHDSGDPFIFVKKIVEKYKELNINPLSKTVIFSDSLNVEKALILKEYCRNKINCSFGIGTNFTNDFDNSPPLNMVIKLWSINNFPVVKLSDVKGKENGDPKAIEIMKWIIKQNNEIKE